MATASTSDSGDMCACRWAEPVVVVGVPVAEVVVVFVVLVVDDCESELSVLGNGSELGEVTVEEVVCSGPPGFMDGDVMPGSDVDGGKTGPGPPSVGVGAGENDSGSEG